MSHSSTLDQIYCHLKTRGLFTVYDIRVKVSTDGYIVKGIMSV